MVAVPAIAAELQAQAEETERVAKMIGALESTIEPGAIVPLDKLERAYSRAVLAVCAGNKSRAAKALGIDRRSLYRMLEPEGA